jgi:predicted NBD/HSP70 family sugar kinase
MLSRTIIELLSRNPMSQASLQDVTQVSLPTLRRAIQQLVESQWIMTVGQSATTGGRPAMLYGLNPQFHAIIGVHLQLPGMNLFVVDLTGTLLHEVHVNSNHPLSPEEVISEITNYVSQFDRQFPERRLLGVGIAAPGYIDPQLGEIISIGRVEGWQNFPISSRITATTGLPAAIVNDIDCMASAEVLHAAAPTDDNLAYVGVYEGIKASVFLNNDLYKGPFGNAGIIGRNRIKVHGEENYQSLEELASIRAITRHFQQQSSTIPEHQDVLDQSDTRLQFQLIMDVAVRGDELCASLIAEMSDLLAAEIANLIYTIQPSILIVGGALSTMPKPLFSSLELQIRQHLPTLLSNQLVIQQAQLSLSNSVPVGLAYQFLHHFVTTEEFELARAREGSAL